MRANYRRAFNALQKIGVPVFVHSDAEDRFDISAEEANSYQFVDYYDGYRMPDWEFGVSPEIINVLRKYGLFAEWMNPGHLRVFEA